jgi:hypothetical protein
MSACLTDGAKQVFSQMLDFQLKDADPTSEKAKALQKLQGLVNGMPVCSLGVMTPMPGKRTLSRWQMCIKKERAGKPFDPAAIKSLAVKYKRGECP